MNTNSIHSPKNPFRVEVSFHRPLEGVGSVQSFTTASEEEALALAVKAVKDAGVGANVCIYKNFAQPPMKTWWRLVFVYTLVKNGTIIAKTHYNYDKSGIRKSPSHTEAGAGNND